MRESVQNAIESAKIDPRDAGAVALLLRYADHLDAPGMPDKYRKHLDALSALIELYGTERHGEALDVIKAALSAQSVASDLGPKLLAGLTALGLTLAGRGDKAREPERAADPARAAHDEIAAKRAERKHNTPA